MHIGFEGACDNEADKKKDFCKEHACPVCANEKEAGQVHCGGTDQKHQRYVPPKAKQKKPSGKKKKAKGEKLGCK